MRAGLVPFGTCAQPCVCHGSLLQDEPLADGRRIFLWGGTFDPPHVGHVLATQWLLSTQKCDEVWWVPVAVHAWGKAPLGFEDRVYLCDLALRSMPDCVSVCDVETRLQTPSRTFRTLEYLQRQHPDATFVLAMGEDVARTREAWYRWSDLEAQWEVVVVPRHGESPEDRFALPPVSSTRVREALASGDVKSLESVVPRRVLKHIVEQGWYRTSGEVE